MFDKDLEVHESPPFAKYSVSEMLRPGILFCLWKENNNSQCSDDTNKRKYCPQFSKCSSMESCGYKIHYCYDKKTSNCNNLECKYEHDCLFGKACKHSLDGTCKLNHIINCPYKICKFGDECRYEHFNNNETKFCENGVSCAHGFHCNFPHKLDYYEKAFEKALNERVKKRKSVCKLFDKIQSDTGCYGFNCCFDHSSKQFDEIYKILESFYKVFKQLKPFVPYFKKSDINTINSETEKRLPCKHGIRCMSLACSYAHTIEEHVQKIMFNCIMSMRMELREFLTRRKLSEASILKFLHGSGKPHTVVMKTLEEHTKYYKEKITFLHEFVKLIKNEKVQKFPYSEFDKNNFPHINNKSETESAKSVKSKNSDYVKSVIDDWENDEEDQEERERQEKEAKEAFEKMQEQKLMLEEEMKRKMEVVKNHNSNYFSKKENQTEKIDIKSENTINKLKLEIMKKDDQIDELRTVVDNQSIDKVRILAENNRLIEENNELMEANQTQKEYIEALEEKIKKYEAKLLKNQK